MQAAQGQAGTGAPLAPRPRRAPPRLLREWGWPLAAGALVLLAYTLYSAWQWNVFTIKSWDLGIFTQLLRQYATLQPPIVPIKGPGFNLLGDHFHPLLAILAPAYGLFPHAFTLLVLQNLCFAVATTVLTWAARRHLGPAIGIATGLAFGLSWGLQYAVEAQFHEVALAVPLLAASLVALIDRRWWWTVAWAAPLVFVKEDLGLTVAVIGVVLAIRGQRRIGAALAGWGVVWFALAVLVILPALNPSGEWAYSGNLGGTGLDPAALFDPRKGQTVLLLLIATAGMLLRSPLALALLPTLAWRFLSGNSGYWGPEWHYSAVLMPIAFTALIDGASLAQCSSRRAWRLWGRLAPPAAAAIALALLPLLPLRVLATPEVFAANPDAGRIEAVLAAVPPGASVETDITYMSYLVDDHTVYWLGNKNPAPDCIAIGPAGGTPAAWGSVAQVAQLLHPETPYRLVVEDAGYSLACRA